MTGMMLSRLTFRRSPSVCFLQMRKLRQSKLSNLHKVHDLENDLNSNLVVWHTTVTDPVNICCLERAVKFEDAYKADASVQFQSLSGIDSFCDISSSCNRINIQ